VTLKEQQMHIPKLLSILNFLKSGCALGIAVTGISSAFASDSDILAIMGGQQNAPYAAFDTLDFIQVARLP
jgi:hypothetical protein